MPKPVVNKFYRKRGYLFRVDDVKDGDVYTVRWKEGSPDGTIGAGLRVSLAVWDRQMKDAVEGRGNIEEPSHA